MRGIILIKAKALGGLQYDRGLYPWIIKSFTNDLFSNIVLGWPMLGEP